MHTNLVKKIYKNLFNSDDFVPKIPADFKEFTKEENY